MADTDFTSDEIAALARLDLYNGNAYDPVTNPYGFDEDGHTVNQMPQGRDNATVGRATKRFATLVRALRDAVAADRVLTAEDAGNTKLDRIATAQNVGLAADQVALAAAQVALAAGQAQRLQGTSTTSQTPATGAKTFATQAGKAFDVGNDVRVQSRSDVNRWMAGRVTAYANGDITVLVEAIGTITTAAADWDIRLAGTRGAQGIQGIPGIPTMGYSARTSNTQIVVADAAKLIDITSGTFAQTFAAAATLGSGFYVVLRNAGTGDITLDPNGSETIDGLASFISYPGEVRLIQCDGTALRSVVLQGFSKTFTASDNFIKPPGYSWFEGRVVAGGGSGARHTNVSNTVGGGCGGAGLPFKVKSTDMGSGVVAAVGAGGLAQNGENSGNNGGDSYFGPFAYARGGRGGSTGTTINNLAGVSKGGQSFIQEPTTCGGSYGNTGFNFPNTMHGGAVGGFITSNNTSGETPGSNSIFAGNGGNAAISNQPGDGQIPGGGGGATRSTTWPSGKGAQGQIDVWGLL